MFKRLFLSITLLVIVGCSGGVKEQDPAGFVGKSVVQFAVFDAERNLAEQYAESYEEENPNVKIRFISLNDILGVPSGDITNGATEEQRLQIAQSADVFHSMFIQELSHAKLTNDLKPFFESDNNVDIVDFYADAIEKATVNGEIRVLPVTLQFTTLFFDKELFDNAGVAYPVPGWTWDDFLATAKALTIRQGDEVVQWGYVDANDNFYDYVRGQLDRSFLDSSTTPPTPRLQDADVATALEGYINLRSNTDIIPANDSRRQGDSGAELIQSGRAAMWRDMTFNDNFSIAAVPTHNVNGKSSQLHIDGYVMSAGTQNPQAAWDWMVYLSRQMPTDDGMVSVPARRSVAESARFWETVDQTTADALRYSLDHSFYDSSLYFSDALFTAVESVLYEGADLDVALATAQVSAEKDIAASIVRANAVPAIKVAGMGANAEGVNPDANEIIFSTGFNSSIGLQAISQQFSQANPDIVVTIKGADFDDREFGFATMAETMDCFVAGPEIETPAHRALIVAIDALFDADASISPDDFFPLMRNQFKQDGQIWAVPAYLTPSVIVYNRDLFDAKGVAYPVDDWTMDDFLDVAIKLTSGEGSDKVYGFVPNADEIFTTMMWLERMGATLLDNSVDPPTITLTSSDFEYAARWYANLTTEAGAKPIFTNDPNQMGSDGVYDDRLELIFGGRAAMWTLEGNVLGGDVDDDGQNGEDLDFETGVVAIPIGAANAGSNLMPAQGYFISAESPHRQECWEWIKFLSANANVPEGIPGRLSVANSAEYKAIVGAEYADAYLNAVEGDLSSNSLYRIAFGKEQWLTPSVFWFGAAMQSVYDDGVPIGAALDDAQIKIDAYWGCIVEGNGIENLAVQSSCIAKIDPSLSNLFE